MKKIVFLFLFALPLYMAQAQCNPAAVVDDVTLKQAGNQVGFFWETPISPNCHPFLPCPPILVQYNVEIEWGTEDINGVISWGSLESFFEVTLLDTEVQNISTTNSVRSRTHVRVRIEFLEPVDSTTGMRPCTHPWSQWFEFSLY